LKRSTIPTVSHTDSDDSRDEREDLDAPETGELGPGATSEADDTCTEEATVEREESGPFTRYRRHRDGEQGEGREATDWQAVVLGFRWPLAMLVIAILAHVAYVQTCRGALERPDPASAAVDRATQAVATIAERFRSGTITTTFTAAIPRLVEDGGMNLEVAVLESTETFRRSDERRVLFDLVNLGTNETEIRVPVTYRYHIQLDDVWYVDVDDHACIVRAPPIRPTLPTAIRTDRMEKRSSRGWLRFDVDEQMEELERSITPTLDERAADGDAIALVREPARRRVAEFVRNWLLVEDHWRSDRFRSVTVIFADEDLPEAERPEPTVVLMEGG
jgi:hypothetical protein